MKTKDTSALLGLTQKEASILLQISRSQLSLYELGLRSIPTAALQRLAELILVVEKTGEVKGKQSLPAEAAEFHQAELQKLLSENNYQQEALSLKIVDLEKKCRDRLKVMQLVQHLEAKGESKTPHEAHGLKLLKTKATQASGKKDWSKLLQYQIKLKVLQHEERLLREEIGE